MNDDSFENEINNLHKEFVASLTDRKNKLNLMCKSSKRQDMKDKNYCLDICDITHQLAGVAGSYGFKNLGNIAGALDSVLSVWISKDDEEINKRLFYDLKLNEKELTTWINVFSAFLREAEKTQTDCSVDYDDECIKNLFSKARIIENT